MLGQVRANFDSSANSAQMKYALLLSKEVASAASFAYIKAAMGLRERKWLRDPRGAVVQGKNKRKEAGIGRKREPGRPSKQFAVGLRERNCLRDPRRAGIGRKREPGRPSKRFAVGLRAEKWLRDPRGFRIGRERESRRPPKQFAVGLRRRKSLTDPRRAVVQGKIRRKEVCRGSQKKKKYERPEESCSISSN